MITEKIEQWKKIQNKIQLQEYLLQQNIKIYMKKQSNNYKEFLEYAINNIKQLQVEHKKLELIHEQAFKHIKNE